MRKEPLITGNLYHIFTKSIAGYKIFRSAEDCCRMIEMIKFYNLEKPNIKFSFYKKAKGKDASFEKSLNSKGKIVQILGYCIMPTHLHMVLAQLKDHGISVFMKNLLNSY